MIREWSGQSYVLAEMSNYSLLLDILPIFRHPCDHHFTVVFNQTLDDTLPQPLEEVSLVRECGVCGLGALRRLSGANTGVYVLHLELR